MTDADNDHKFKEATTDAMSVARADPTAHQPETVPALLRSLQVRQASVIEEMDALRCWLRHNTPNPPLRSSFHRNGYGPLLSERFGRSNERSICTP